MTIRAFEMPAGGEPRQGRELHPNQPWQGGPQHPNGAPNAKFQGWVLVQVWEQDQDGGGVEVQISGDMEVIKRAAKTLQKFAG